MILSGMNAAEVGEIIGAYRDAGEIWHTACLMIYIANLWLPAVYRTCCSAQDLGCLPHLYSHLAAVLPKTYISRQSSPSFASLFHGQVSKAGVHCCYLYQPCSSHHHSDSHNMIHGPLLHVVVCANACVKLLYMHMSNCCICKCIQGYQNQSGLLPWLPTGIGRSRILLMTFMVTTDSW